MSTATEAGSAINSKGDKQHRVRWLALLVLSLGVLVGVVDTSVISVATPAMQEEFNATQSQMLLVVTIYSLVFASFLLLFGKVGSKIGLRRLQAMSAGLFGLSSLLIALALAFTLPNVRQGGGERAHEAR